MNAPRLSGQGAWYLERQLKLFKQGARGTHEKDMFGKMMAPMAATLADDTAIADVAAYIATLPDAPAAPTIKGDVDKGRQRYATCAACHGADGRGFAATNAPRLKGMSDWYMATQLKNFRDGVRGAHAQDIYGAPDGADRRDAGRRCCDRRRPGLHQLALIQQRETCMTTYVAHDESEFAPPAEIGGGRALSPEDLHRQVHLEPGCEGDRDPVRGHRDRRSGWWRWCSRG